ncbi:hypothetical protein MERGE_002495 [Pneumocystis wakefieldiae]|uniref:ribose-phosphate diphosphokinase n=1 Tax=Pneumocystis wakefieldiae TaxID=38082 RepID=A0A899FMH2_9ASCO|nr:hypothetical protein MERGE_002495 [Pneumocystis wakefieldiae]
MRPFHIFSGSTHPELTQLICEHLGFKPSRSRLEKFSNGETKVVIDRSVRNNDVYIIQTGSGRVNDALMELLIMIHACKGASSHKVTVVLPFFPYSRYSDTKCEHSVEYPNIKDDSKPYLYHSWAAQMGTLMSSLFACVGCDHIITMDLHDPQFQGFFNIPVDNLGARGVFQKYIIKHIPGYLEAVIVSPDAGGAKRATAIADTLRIDFALIHKERKLGQQFYEMDSEMMLVGHVEDKVAILIDDIIDTANTLIKAAKMLTEHGATKVYSLATHAVFSGDAIERINESTLHKVIVTNSVPQTENVKRCPKLVVLDVSFIFAEAIRKIHHGQSLSMLFDYSL